jgi:hypothetical protein
LVGVGFALRSTGTRGNTISHASHLDWRSGWNPIGLQVDGQEKRGQDESETKEKTVAHKNSKKKSPN